MDRVSRPLIGLLVATVAFFALWITMLKPGSPTSGANAGNIARNPSLGQLGGAVSAAHAAVATSDGASVRHGGTVASSAAPGTASAAVVTGERTAASAPASHLSPARPPTVPTPTARHVSAVRHASRTRIAHRSHLARMVARLTPADRLALITRALASHRVFALLFFNPGAADDRAVDRELAAVPVHRGLVLKLAVPLDELAGYTTLTEQAPISTSPTLLIVDGARHATELIGFADRFEIAQRVADALAASPTRRRG